MKSVVILVTLLFAPLVKAAPVSYGQRNCTVLEEERGTHKGSDICILKISCEKYALNNPDSFVQNRLVGYCLPLESGRCPTKPQNCLDDESLAASDIPKIKPLADRPSTKPCSDSEGQQGTATIVPVESNGGRQ